MQKELIFDENPPHPEIAYKALADLYHAVFTGTVLTTVTRQSSREAAEMIFQVFRRQHLEKFLPAWAF